MPARQAHPDAAWLAAENGILQPAVGPAAERRAAVHKSAAARSGVLSTGRARRDTIKGRTSTAIAADASSRAGELLPAPHQATQSPSEAAPPATRPCLSTPDLEADFRSARRTCPAAFATDNRRRVGCS